MSELERRAEISHESRKQHRHRHRHRHCIPLLQTQTQRLDVECTLHPFAADKLLDATWRHAGAQHALKGAARTDGFAAAEGEKDKAKRYPAAAGKVVTPCAAELWERPGVHFMGLLDELQALAKARQVERGLPPTRWKQRWLYEVSELGARSMAKAVLLSQQGNAE